MSDLGIVLNKSVNGNEDIKYWDAFSYSNSTLYDFLRKTSDTDVAADVIDPLTTFDVEFAFYPTKADGGTFLANLAEQVFKSGFSNYKFASNSSQLILNLGFYIQSMTLPQMTMPEAGKVPTLFGEFPVNNLYVKPDNNTFTMSILNTKVSIHDYIFYPWMREVTMPCWSYETQPYTTATVTVKFDKHSNSRCVFCGCRPSQIQSRQPTQEPTGEPTRDVTMLFDYMFITGAWADWRLNYYDTALKNAGDLFLNTQKMNNQINAKF